MNTPKPRKRGWLIAIIAILLVLLLAFWGVFFLRGRLPGSASSDSGASSTGAAASAPQGSGTDITEVYLLSLGAGRMVALDRNGNVLLEAESIDVLTDMATGLPRFLVARTYRAAEPYPILTASALYGLDGILLQEAQSMQYWPGVGDTVLRGPIAVEGQTDLSLRVLINAHSGETVREDVSTVSNVGLNTAALHTYDSLITSLVDENLEVIREFPQPQYCILRYMNGLYAGYTSPGSMDGDYATIYLLDENFERILDTEYSDIQLLFPNENYILLSRYKPDGSAAEYTLWDINEGTNVMDIPPDKSLYYCTGQLMVVSTPELGSQTLTDMQGNVLGEYDRIVITDFTPLGGDAGPLFAQAGDTFYRLAKDGSVEAEAQLPGMRMMNSIAPGLFSADDGGEQGVVLYNQDFEVLVSAGQYLSLTSFFVDGVPYIQAQHTAFDATMSLLDADGNLLLEAYVPLGGASGDRLLVDWQGHRGMIDLQGNWLYQTGIPADVVY